MDRRNGSFTSYIYSNNYKQFFMSDLAPGGVREYLGWDIVGGDGADNIFLSGTFEQLTSFASSDVIDGAGGSDNIYAGPGDDVSAAWGAWRRPLSPSTD